MYLSICHSADECIAKVNVVLYRVFCMRSSLWDEEITFSVVNIMKLERSVMLHEYGIYFK